MSATAISNAVDKRHYDERENQYLATVNRYTKDEANLFPNLFAITAEALEANPEQDFLGDLYMQLGMAITTSANTSRHTMWPIREFATRRC